MTVVTIETPILYWWEWRTERASAWSQLAPTAPPQLYMETLLSLRMGFHNYGSTTKYVLPWMNVTPPSGQTFGLGPPGEVKTEVPAGGDGSYTFEPVALNEVGTWQAMFFVSEADTPDAIPEDMHTDPMNVAAVTAPPVDITPVLSAVLGIAMLGMVMSMLPGMLGGE